MSSQLAQGQEMEIRGPEPTSGKQVAIRRQALPKELEALGVKALVDPESEMQVLVIPKELRQKANVLTPVQAFQQADPNWRPSLRVVELDPSDTGPHFYKQAGGLAPRKQALELLADAAGIVQMRTQLLGRERVLVGDVPAETFTHLAIGKVRRSDGTLRTIEASRTYEPFAEYEEICTAVASKFEAGSPAYAREVRKRWLNEIKFAKAKNESKAINRVMRSMLQISHTFKPADAAKPFVVVGWNLSPQDSAEVRTAFAQLYGAEAEMPELEPPVSHDWDPPEDAEGEVVHEDDDASMAAVEASSDQQGDAVESHPVAPAASPADPENASAGSSPQGPAESVRELLGATDAEAPDPTPLTPDPAPTLSLAVEALSAEEQQRLPGALAMMWPRGGHQERSLNYSITRPPADTADLFAKALRFHWREDPEFKAALELVVKAYRPEIYAAWEEGL